MEVTIKPSEKLLNLLLSLKNHPSVPENIQKVQEGENPGFLNVSDIRWLKNELKKEDSQIHLHELLQNSEVIIPTLPPPPPRNPELEKRIQRLKAEQEQREYDRMVASVSSKNKTEAASLNIAHEVRQINAQLIEVLGFIVSLGAAFAFGFFGLHMWIGPLEFGTRSLLGIFFTIVIGIAELYFLVRTLDYSEKVSSDKKVKTS